MPAVMLALDATINLRSKRGKRTIAAPEFFLGAFTTALAEDELIIDIVVPPLPRGAGTAYVSFEQPASGYALVAAAAVVGRSRKTVNHAVVALTGVADVARRMASADQLVGTNAELDALARIGGGAGGLELQGDIHAPADYRRHLVTVATRDGAHPGIESGLIRWARSGGRARRRPRPAIREPQAAGAARRAAARGLRPRCGSPGGGGRRCG